MLSSLVSLPHHIAEGEAADKRISSAWRITPSRIDSKSEAQCLKLPRLFTSISRPGRVPSASWDGIAKETAAISDSSSRRAAATRKIRRRKTASNFLAFDEPDGAAMDVNVDDTVGATHSKQNNCSI